jgi:hypothetical protein
MDAIEFVVNYKKYVSEIRAIIKSNLEPVINKIIERDPHDLITPETWFPNETAARGYVWSQFIDAVNEYSYQTITIDIKDINSIEDMELFFALLFKERIFYHPESSFRDVVNTDIYRNQTVRTFTDEESERLDKLNEKCFEIAERENVDIFETSMRIQKLIWGEPKKISSDNP